MTWKEFLEKAAGEGILLNSVTGEELSTKKALTDAQKNVLIAILPTPNGGALSQQEIAKQLCITIGTVRDHLTAIYARFLITGEESKIQQLREKLKAAFPPQTQEPPKQQLFGSSQFIDIKKWVGRDKLLADLHQEIVTGKKVIAIVGQGGMGKRSLAIKSIESVGVDLETKTLTAKCPYKYVLFLRVRESDGFDTVTAALLDMLEPGVTTSQLPRQTIDRIISGLNKYRCLIVLDNLDSLLRGDTGQSISSEIGNLLNQLVYWRHQSQIIFTSRSFPLDLADRRGGEIDPEIDPELVRKVVMTGISPEASIELLRQIGMISEADVQLIATLVGGNVLILKLLATISLEKPGFIQKNPDLVSKKATPIIEAQFNHQSLAGQELLRRICVLRIGINETELTTLRLMEQNEDVLNLLNDGELEPSQVEIEHTRLLLRGLVNSGLIEETYDKSTCESLYTLHQLAREVLVAKHKETLPLFYRYAARFYQSMESPAEFHNFDDLRILLEKLYFYWQIGLYEIVTKETIDFVLPKLSKWSYWLLVKEWCELVINYSEGVDYRFCLQMLGGVCRSLGDWTGAQKYFRCSLDHAEKAHDSKGIAKSLGLLSNIERKYGNWKTAEEFHQKALELRTKIGDRLGIATSLAALANIQSKLGNWKKAEELYQQSLNIRVDLNNHSGMSASWISLGHIQLRYGNWAKAEEFFMKSLEIRVNSNNRAGVTSAWVLIGHVERNRGNYKEAENLFRQSLELRKELEDIQGIASVFGLLGDLENKRGNYSEAEKLCQQSLKIYEKLEDRSGIATSWRLLGDTENKNGNYNEADNFYQESLKIRRELSDRAGVAQLIDFIGKNELGKGNLDKAKELLENALSEFKALNMKDCIAEVHWDLAQLYRAKDKYSNAKQYYYLAHQLYTQLGAKADIERIEREWNN